jgi:uncharacterized repeat protein (TIGR01451 family)
MVTCTRATMPLGADAFTLVVNATTPGGTSNTANVTSTNEGASGDESSTATTTISGGTDLSITKSGPATVQPGQQFTYNITVANHGPEAATNTGITDALPAGLSFVSAVPSQGSCSGTTTVTCNLGTLNIGSTATIALTVKVTATGGTISNTATVDSAETDPTPGNASSTSQASVAGGVPVPTMSGWALLLLIAILVAVAIKLL